MTNREYLERWIKDVANDYKTSSFYYSLEDDSLNIIKYSDELQHNSLFKSEVSKLIIDFRGKYNEDIVVLNMSDDLFEIECPDFVYGNEISFPISEYNTYAFDGLMVQGQNCLFEGMSNNYALAA